MMNFTELLGVVREVQITSLVQTHQVIGSMNLEADLHLDGRTYQEATVIMAKTHQKCQDIEISRMFI